MVLIELSEWWVLSFEIFNLTFYGTFILWTWNMMKFQRYSMHGYLFSGDTKKTETVEFLRKLCDYGEIEEFFFFSSVWSITIEKYFLKCNKSTRKSIVTVRYYIFLFHCFVCCLKLRIEFLKHIITKTDKRSAQIPIMMKKKKTIFKELARLDPNETYKHNVFAHIFTYIHVHTCFKRFTFWSDIIISKFYSSVPCLYLRFLNSFLLHLLSQKNFCCHFFHLPSAQLYEMPMSFCCCCYISFHLHCFAFEH